MNGPWRLDVKRSAARDLRRLDPPVRRRVLNAIEGLTVKPAGGDIRQLSGRLELRSLVGDWRVLFERETSTRTLVIPPLSLRPDTAIHR